MVASYQGRELLSSRGKKEAHGGCVRWRPWLRRGRRPGGCWAPRMQSLACMAISGVGCSCSGVLECCVRGGQQLVDVCSIFVQCMVLVVQLGVHGTLRASVCVFRSW